jgi:23S rRNA pseudouridine1911/1915/1917 synthase
MNDERWVWVPFEVDKKFDGYRIDRFLAQRLAGYSRSKVQSILSEARVLKEGRAAKANSKVQTGDHVQIAYLRRPEKPLAADTSIPVIFEDDDLIIVNKPADLLSHPTDKIVNNTVLGILRHSRPDLPKLHLLHRLDRETSGVIALAKNANAARAWTRHMEAHRIRKEYIAIVRGQIDPPEGMIGMPIGRQGGEIRVRQWVDVPGAVAAATAYEMIGGTRTYSVIRVFPKTGRLHQIRVHFAALGHPLLGDPLYTGAGEIYQKMIAGQCTEADRSTLGFRRVALHAAALTFPHPVSKSERRVEAPLPEDMESLTLAISDKLMLR